ncbi:MAG: chorismate synthase [Bacteroidales bacterium]
MNTFGNIFRLTTFGESHGVGVGGVVDGCPPGVEVDIDFIQQELNRRKPGQSHITTPRKEDDKVEILSGVFEGKSTGTPIGFVVYNQNQKSKDYDNIKNVYRPSHADYTYDMKYGFRDYRGGGRSSARETIARVVGGAIAKQLLDSLGVKVCAYVSQVHDIVLDKPYTELNLSEIDSNVVRCPDKNIADKMIAKIEEATKKHESVGGIISGVAKGVPTGWGEPVFDKLHARLGFAMLGINAAKGFEIGAGFNATNMYGSEHNDTFVNREGKICTLTNNSGGVQGGISNGDDIYFNVAFKPIATLLKKQKSVNSDGEEIEITPKGRHDACVLPRAVPIVEAMTALVLADAYLEQKRNS